MNEETRQLVDRAQAGDRTALADLIDRYRSHIQGLVRKKLGGRLRTNLESSDVVQSVCLEAMRSLAELDYRSEAGFVRWLARIADNTIRDTHRYFGARKRHNLAAAGDQDMVPVSQARGAGPTPSRTARDHEQVDLVIAALDRLPDDYRRIIILTRFEKKTHEQAAAIMGKTGKATRMLLARARVRLLRELDEGLRPDG